MGHKRVGGGSLGMGGRGGSLFLRTVDEFNL
jgi:hypothetical protein